MLSNQSNIGSILLLLFWSIGRNVVADDRLVEVAQSPEYHCMGIALSKSNRMFAALPRYINDVTLSVAEITSSNILTAFPGGRWNTFNPTSSTDNPEERFINVNAVFTDANDNLWVVDIGSVGSRTYTNGSKLVKISLRSNQVERVYYTSSLNVPAGFALNDVRIGSRHAYLTESGLGSVVIINLENGQVRRVLDEHPSTKFAEPTVVRMEGRVILDEQGQPKKMHNNNLELTPDEKTLYYKPSLSYNWFAIATADLLNESLSPSQLGEKVSTSWKAMPTGGTTMDDQGFIYLMDIERQAIWQQSTVDGSWKLLVRDERIGWGDASDVSADGYLYVPMSQNNRIPAFNNGTNQVVKPFRVYKIQISSSASVLAFNILVYLCILLASHCSWF